MSTVQAATILQPGEIALREYPMPEIEDDALLMRVAAVGVCGSDKHMYGGNLDMAWPVIPGHEFSGIVEKLGPQANANMKDRGRPHQGGRRHHRDAGEPGVRKMLVLHPRAAPAPAVPEPHGVRVPHLRRGAASFRGVFRIHVYSRKFLRFETARWSVARTGHALRTSGGGPEGGRAFALPGHPLCGGGVRRRARGAPSWESAPSDCSWWPLSRRWGRARSSRWT